MKAAQTLAKVKQQSLDEMKRKINALQTKRDEIHKTIDTLSDKLTEEMNAAADMPELNHFFGDFSAHIKKRQDQLKKMSEQTQVQIDQMSEEIREIFKEIKSYELVYEQWQKREAKAKASKEQAEFDDIALQRYTAKQEHQS